MEVVIVIQPAIEGESLTVEQQINQVFGPFNDDEAMEEFIKVFEEKNGETQYKFLILQMDKPKL